MAVRSAGGEIAARQTTGAKVATAGNITILHIRVRNGVREVTGAWATGGPERIGAVKAATIPVEP